MTDEEIRERHIDTLARMLIKRTVRRNEAKLREWPTHIALSDWDAIARRIDQILVELNPTLRERVYALEALNHNAYYATEETDQS